MSARAPRRTFAASFVITVAAAPGCMTAPPPHPDRPPPSEPAATPVERDHRDDVPTPVERDHRAQPDRVQPDRVQGDRAQADRPESVHGNPPPPPPPMPPRVPPSPQSPPVVVADSPPATTERHWVLEMHDGKCTTRGNANCPPLEPGKPMRTCNPPAPRAYTCLAGMTEGASLQIVQWAGAKDCVIPPPQSNCPKGAMCNPPPPRRVTCPQ